MITMTTTVPRRTNRRTHVDAVVADALDTLHLAALRQASCPIDASCLLGDTTELAALLAAVAGMAGPCDRPAAGCVSFETRPVLNTEYGTPPGRPAHRGAAPPEER
jgi:hypothetical protein